MKICNVITMTVMIFLSLFGFRSTFTNEEVNVHLPRELICMFNEMGLEFEEHFLCASDAYDGYYLYGNISYKSQDIIENTSIVIGDCGDDTYELTTFPLSNLSEQEYTITSYSNGGCRLTVEAETQDNGEYVYNKVTLVYPLHMPHDSVVCMDVRFESESFGFELMEFASRPCDGNIKVYRVDGYETYLAKEMVKADDEKTVWNEYYNNGNLKNVLEITHKPDYECVDEYGFWAYPYKKEMMSYFPDGHEDNIFNGKEYVVFMTGRRYHSANSVIHLILYPEDGMDISYGDAWFVGGDFDLSEPFEIASCSYRIDGDRIYFTSVLKKELYVFGYRSTPRKYYINDFSATIDYDDSSRACLTFDNFLDEGDMALAYLSWEAFADDAIMGFPDAFKRMRYEFSSKRINEPVKSFNW